MPISTKDNEKEWLMKAALGDEAAFAQLFYAYHNKLGAYIFRLTQSREIAQEIVQDVFIKIWISRETLANVSRFGPYLYVLSRNHALNCLRQLAGERVRKLKAATIIHELYEVNEVTESTPDYYTLIDRAVEELPPQQHKAYILSRRERLKYEEVARRMDISRETVKKYLKLATRFIKGYVRAHTDLLLIVLLIVL